MDRELFNKLLVEVKQIPIENILNHYGVYREGNKYSCPKHEDKHPSAAIYKNKLKCFSCNQIMDNIDLVQHFEKCSLPKAIEILSDKSYIDRTPIKKDNIELKKATTYEEKIKWFIRNRATTNEYLRNRGLDPNVAKQHLYNNGYRMGVDKLLQIVYDFNTFAIVKGPKGKFNWGTPKPIYLKNHLVINDKWFICEGIEDALSALEMGYNAISLNSVSNISKLLKDPSIGTGEFIYILALDNDKGGIEGENKIKNYFDKHDIKYKVYRSLKKSTYNDLNEYYNKCLSCYNIK